MTMKGDIACLWKGDSFYITTHLSSQLSSIYLSGSKQEIYTCQKDGILWDEKGIIGGVGAVSG
jgi:hypothetical protein